MDILAVLTILIYFMSTVNRKEEKKGIFDLLMGVITISSVLLIFYKTYEPLKTEFSYVYILP